ncbi:MAG: long-chain fatty acid--CoA ligase [Candidatus Neomarinimicrobiota bacterium]|jgi:long-chain acyl-CoA synthetase|nr:long-chain fatty acid--CoA ligase [Candidatus Neomarinimicrobiota bacterium]MDD3966619.1 long-chain fatty acid--CoA ligase [Candidatus Neomarinimicrobiota bacterium]
MHYSIHYLRNLPDIFADACLGGRNRSLYHYKQDGVWKSYTYQESYDIFEKLGFGLRALGLREHDKVAILSENRPEWCFIDWACAHFNMISVPIYQTSVPRQIEFILNHAECRVLIASNKEQALKVIPLKGSLKFLEYIIVMDEEAFDDAWIISLREVLEKGEEEQKGSSKSMQDFAAGIRDEDLWSIVYTSGTTGEPKGVMLSHFNIAANIQQTQAHEQIQHNKRWLSFLPLSHSFERAASIFTVWIGAEIYFAESIAKVVENMKEVKPNYMTTVPRLLDKIYSLVIEQVSQGPAAKEKIFHWAEKIGEEVVAKYLSRNRAPLGVASVKYGLAKRLVFNKISGVFGGNMIACISGGAPLSAKVGAFFTAAGIRVLEGFGLTEMSPITHANQNDFIKFGTVGRALPDMETRILEDGEILVRGPNRMLGYYKDPEGSAGAIDKDGWFHTGDIGYVDEDGFLKITDRKKDIIVTSGGKNVAPAAVERAITASKYIEQAVVIGDRRKYLVVLLVPMLETLQEWGRHQQPPLEFRSYADLKASPEIEKLIRDELARNQQDLARYEQIKYFYITPRPFTIEGGELTPSLKVKRKKIMEMYRDEIETMYKD